MCVGTPCTGLLCSGSDTRFLVVNILGAKPDDRVLSIYCLTLLSDHAGAMHVEQDALSDLVTPWLIFYALAVVVSLLAIFIKLKVFYRQLRCGPHFGRGRHKPPSLAPSLCNPCVLLLRRFGQGRRKIFLFRYRTSNFEDTRRLEDEDGDDDNQHAAMQSVCATLCTYKPGYSNDV